MYRSLEKSKEEAGIFGEEARRKFIEAGKISAQAIEYGRSLIKPGVKAIDVLDKVEEKINSLGGSFSFPPQISLNDAAAHGCPDHGDKTVFKDQLVKLDVGAQVDGYVTDNAITIDLSGKWGDLVKASREALEAAIKLAVPGTTLGEIGRNVQEIIQSYGFSPVRNLSGHGVGRYLIHTKPTIPNIITNDKTELKEGMVIAIEPFASTGSGMVHEIGEAGVFMLVNKKPIRDLMTRNVLKKIESYGGLPFAKKWLTREFGAGKTNFALRQLLQNDMVHEYPPLVDSQHGFVSQAERTVMVGEKPVVLTDYKY